MVRSNALKPIPSLAAYSVPCSEPGPVRSYASAGRQHRLRRQRLLSRGRSGTLWPEEARVASGDPAILDRAHVHIWFYAVLPYAQLYIFFAVDSMCLLPASGLLSPAFAPARRAHPATGRPVLSPLSPGAARHRGGRRAVEAGALEHLGSPGRGPSSGANSASRPKISAPAAGRERSWRPPDGAVGAIVWLSYRVWGYFSYRGPVRVVRSKMVEFFFIAEMDRSRRAESDGVGPVNRPS